MISQGAREGGILESDLPNLPTNDRPSLLLEKFAGRCRSANGGMKLLFLLFRIQPTVFWYRGFFCFVFFFC